jgi:hypothetical protein
MIRIKFVVTKLPHCYDLDSKSRFALWANEFVRKTIRPVAYLVASSDLAIVNFHP